MEAMKILHPLARGISSLAIPQAAINFNMSARCLLEISFDENFVSGYFNASNGSLKYANGMIEFMHEKALPEKRSVTGVFIRVISMIDLSSYLLNSQTDIATTDVRDQTLALAKWKAVQQGEKIRECSLISATLVLFRTKNESRLLHDTYHWTHISPTMRIERFVLSTDNTRYSCRKDKGGFVYSHVDLIENIDPRLRDIGPNSRIFKIKDVTLNVLKDQYFKPSLMALALGVLQECHCSSTKVGSIRSTIKSHLYGLLPLKSSYGYFNIILEAMGRTMNREMSTHSLYRSELKTLGMTVNKGLLRAHTAQRLSMECIYDKDDTIIISGGTNGLGLLISDCLRNQVRMLISFSRSGTLISISHFLKTTNCWTIQKYAEFFDRISLYFFHASTFYILSYKCTCMCVCV